MNTRQTLTCLSSLVLACACGSTEGLDGALGELAEPASNGLVADEDATRDRAPELDTPSSASEPDTTTPGVFEPGSPERERARVISEAIARVAPSAGAISFPARIQRAFVARTNRLEVVAPVTGSRWLELAQRDRSQPIQIRVGLPLADSEAAAVLASDGTVTYTNERDSTDVAVQTFEDGVRIQTVLHGPDAPTQFVYAMQLPEATHLEKSADGSVQILDAASAFLGGIGAPWAFDAGQRPVQTHYEIVDGSLVQVVEHDVQGVEYPVVADPWFGLSLIDRAEWQLVSEGWVFHVYPTLWAIAHPLGGAPEAGWDELYDKYGGSGLNTNLGSMRNQYICHHMFNIGGIFGGDTWDLEEWVPDIGLPGFIAGRCNPQH